MIDQSALRNPLLTLVGRGYDGNHRQRALIMSKIKTSDKGKLPLFIAFSGIIVSSSFSRVWINRVWLPNLLVVS